jgi:hypothetical protein
MVVPTSVNGFYRISITPVDDSGVVLGRTTRTYLYCDLDTALPEIEYVWEPTSAGCLTGDGPIALGTNSYLTSTTEYYHVLLMPLWSEVSTVQVDIDGVNVDTATQSFEVDRNGRTSFSDCYTVGGQEMSFDPTSSICAFATNGIEYVVYFNGEKPTEVDSNGFIYQDYFIAYESAEGLTISQTYNHQTLCSGKISLPPLYTPATGD